MQAQIIEIQQTQGYGRFRALVRLDGQEFEAFGLSEQAAVYRALCRAREAQETRQ